MMVSPGLSRSEKARIISVVIVGAIVAYAVICGILALAFGVA